MKEITIDDVKSFLNSINVKIDVYGMVFAERQRCQETMSGVVTFGHSVKTSTEKKSTLKLG